MTILVLSLPRYLRKLNAPRFGATTLLAALFLNTLGLSAHAAPTSCPANFYDGQAPDLVNAKLATHTYSLCFSEFAVLDSGLTRTPLYSADHLTAERIALARRQRRVDAALVFGIHAGKRIENFAVDCIDRFQDASAEIARFIAVAKLDRFVRAGRGARWDGRPPFRTVLKEHIDLDRRIAPAVQDFAADDIDDCGHERS